MNINVIAARNKLNHFYLSMIVIFPVNLFVHAEGKYQEITDPLPQQPSI